MRVLEDVRLLNLIKNNPDAGISQAIDAYGGSVHTICKNILRGFSDEDIEEAVADTFFKLWKNAHKINSTKENSLKSYLYEIARNTSIDKIRSIKGIEMLELEEDFLISKDTVEDEFEKRESEKRIHKLVEDLKEPDKTIFLLRFFYFYKIKDIADKLSLTPKSVEHRIARSKEKLKALLFVER